MTRGRCLPSRSCVCASQFPFQFKIAALGRALCSEWKHRDVQDMAFLPWQWKQTRGKVIITRTQLLYQKHVLYLGGKKNKFGKIQEWECKVKLRKYLKIKVRNADSLASFLITSSSWFVARMPCVCFPLPSFLLPPWSYCTKCHSVLFLQPLLLIANLIREIPTGLLLSLKERNVWTPGHFLKIVSLVPSKPGRS